MRPIYAAGITRCAAAHSAATARNTGAKPPSLSDIKCNWVLLHALHNTGDEAIMVTCFA